MKESSLNKTVIYIDSANILLSAQNINFDLNLLKLIQHLKDSFRTQNVIYFTGKFPSMRKKFMELEEFGVEMIYKEIYSESNKTKANCDVEISHRITSDILLGEVDHIILLSGDGDFVHLLDYANNKNLLVKVYAFDPSSCSRMIKKREYTKLSYLSEMDRLIQNEKPPVST